MRVNAGYFAAFDADQKKGCPSSVFFQQGENLRRGARVGSVVDGQPGRFLGRPIFCQDGAKALKGRDEGDSRQQDMRGEQNVQPPKPTGGQHGRTSGTVPGR